MAFYNTGTNYLDEYGQKPTPSTPAPYVPYQPAAPSLPPSFPHDNGSNGDVGYQQIPRIPASTGGGGGSSYSPPPAAPPPQAPSTTLPMFNFNANTDPGVLAALGLENQGLGQLDANLKAARERAIIGFGDPSLAAEAGFGLDPQAGAFAKQNYLSGNATLARIDKQDKLARQAIINKLVSHGLLRSGDLGYQQGEENTAYGNNVYDAKQQLLDYLSGLFQTYQSQRNQISQNELNARLAALQNVAANPDAYAGMYG